MAVQSSDRASILEELDLVPTGERQAWPEAEYALLTLPSGWTVVVAADALFADDDDIAIRLSGLGEVVCCSIEEHAMVSVARGVAEGQERWWVAHDAQQGLFHLDVVGHLPDVFGVLCAAALQQQTRAGGSDAGVDHVFDVPADLCAHLTGFRHDEPLESDGEPAFEVLATGSRLSASLSDRLKTVPPIVDALLALAAQAIDAAFSALEHQPGHVGLVAGEGSSARCRDLTAEPLDAAYQGALQQFRRLVAEHGCALCYAGPSRLGGPDGHAILVSVGHPAAEEDLLIVQPYTLSPLRPTGRPTLHHDLPSAEVDRVVGTLLEHLHRQSGRDRYRAPAS